jgi:hypothetical protein
LQLLREMPLEEKPLTLSWAASVGADPALPGIVDSAALVKLFEGALAKDNEALAQLNSYSQDGGKTLWRFEVRSGSGPQILTFAQARQNGAAAALAEKDFGSGPEGEKAALEQLLPQLQLCRSHSTRTPSSAFSVAEADKVASAWFVPYFEKSRAALIENKAVERDALQQWALQDEEICIKRSQADYFAWQEAFGLQEGEWTSASAQGFARLLKKEVAPFELAPLEQARQQVAQLCDIAAFRLWVSEQKGKGFFKEAKE